MKSFSILSSLALALSTVPFVSAHGHVNFITIDGKKYTGPNPGAKAGSSVIRPVNSINPTYGAQSAGLNCGPGSKPASKSANANPGSTIAINWVTGNKNWAHDTGGQFTYLANCGKGGCENFDSKQAKWFKIDEKTVKNGRWSQADQHAGKPDIITLPSTLAAGNYLMMHQLISLHIASKRKGAEFYSSCSQLKVGGNQKGAPSADELVTIPGSAYNDNDKGILVNAFDTKAKYVSPGPRVAKLAGRVEPVNNGSEPETPETPEFEVPEPEAPESEEPEYEEPSATASANPPKATSCKKSKRDSVAARNETTDGAEYRPRHISRVMRSIAQELGSSSH